MPHAPLKLRITQDPAQNAVIKLRYGKTPHEAAGQLSRWLSLAHGAPRPQL